MELAADTLLNLSPQLLVDLALGVEPLEYTASRYGFTPEQLRALAAHPVVYDRVNQVRTELKKEGTTVKWKARFATEDLLRDLYIKAKRTESLPALNDAVKTLAKLGDLEPKSQIATSLVPFQIIFQLDDGTPSPAPVQEGNVVSVQHRTRRINLHTCIRQLPAAILDTDNSDLAYE